MLGGFRDPQYQAAPPLPKGLSQHVLQGIHLDGVAQRRTRAVALDEPDVLGLQSTFQQPWRSWA